MAKARVTFLEVVKYEADIEVPDAYGDSLEDIGDRGEPHWFDLLDDQHPDWPTKCVVGVEERQQVCIVLERSK